MLVIVCVVPLTLIVSIFLFNSVVITLFCTGFVEVVLNSESMVIPVPASNSIVEFPLWLVVIVPLVTPPWVNVIVPLPIAEFVIYPALLFNSVILSFGCNAVSAKVPCVAVANSVTL